MSFTVLPHKTVKVSKIFKPMNFLKKIVRFHFGWGFKKMMFILRSRFEMQPHDLLVSVSKFIK